MRRSLTVFFLIAVVSAYISGCNKESSGSAPGTASRIEYEPGTILLSFSKDATLQEAGATVTEQKPDCHLGRFE